MPIQGTGDGFAHTNGARQASVQGRGPFASWDRPTAVEVHHLTGGMNAGIGATGSKGLHRSVRIELGDGVFQYGLNTATVALALPPTKRRTLVLKAERDPLKGRWLRTCRRGFGVQTSGLT